MCPRVAEHRPLTEVVREYDTGGTTGPYVHEVDEVSRTGDHDPREHLVERPLAEQRPGDEPGSGDPEQLDCPAGDFTVPEGRETRPETAPGIARTNGIVVPTTPTRRENREPGRRADARAVASNSSASARALSESS